MSEEPRGCLTLYLHEVEMLLDAMLLAPTKALPANDAYDALERKLKAMRAGIIESAKNSVPAMPQGDVAQALVTARRKTILDAFRKG